ALLALHDRVFNGLGTGAAAWFAEALRRPESIGDLSNEQRRKMPALMRGADGRGLCLTHRHINSVIRAAAWALRKDAASPRAPVPGAAAAGIHVGDYAAQIHHRSAGNPFCTLPRSAISNCFPGLEFDFRNLWRRAFRGIVLSENNNYVVDADPEFRDLVGHRLVAVDGKPTMVPTVGPTFPQGDNVPLSSSSNPNGVSFMEWSNSLARVLQKQGRTAECYFTPQPSPHEVVVGSSPEDLARCRKVTLTVNTLFQPGTASLSADAVQPGELTQGLCAPWQNDYRECACYYWAASRPDFVNVVPDAKGLSAGDMWMAKKRTGRYIPDDRTDSRLLSYDDLFLNWQGELHFVIRGRDALASPPQRSPES
ncbi:MAG: hypothetical protein JNL97_07450, partial [Verrucomicrobiales bacterium]|nr:hypothetical protein [Verrucomicrobiales bacterium]